MATPQPEASSKGFDMNESRKQNDKPIYKLKVMTDVREAACPIISSCLYFMTY